MFRLARFKTEHMPINDSKIIIPIITNHMLSKIGLVIIVSSLVTHSGKFREMTRGKFSSELLFWDVLHSQNSTLVSFCGHGTVGHRKALELTPGRLVIIKPLAKFLPFNWIGRSFIAWIRSLFPNTSMVMFVFRNLHINSRNKIDRMIVIMGQMKLDSRYSNILNSIHC